MRLTQLDGINANNFKLRSNDLRKIANMSEPFQSTNPYISSCDDRLIRKNERLYILVIIIFVLITAFILLGNYMSTRGIVSTKRTNDISADNT